MRRRDPHRGVSSGSIDRSSPETGLLIPVPCLPPVPSRPDDIDKETLMTLSERLAEYVCACFSGLWLQSHEHDDAIQEIARLCHDRNWSFASWDVDRGLGLTVGAAEAALAGTADPLAAIRAAGSIAPDDGAAVLVLRNFHRFLGSAEIVQAIDTQLAAGKQNRTTLIILSPVVQIPPELERQF